MKETFKELIHVCFFCTREFPFRHYCDRSLGFNFRFDYLIIFEIFQITRVLSVPLLIAERQRASLSLYTSVCSVYSNLKTCQWFKILLLLFFNSNKNRNIKKKINKARRLVRLSTSPLDTSTA